MSRLLDFREEFERTYEIKDRARRGKALEKLLGKFFKKYSFDVTLNPKGAKPRQSDLFVHFEDNSILIEAKWQKRKVDVNDIDSLRSRLKKFPADIIGAIFSMSGFSKTAIQEVENDRTREIVLFTPHEIASLFNNEIGIYKLIEMKRDLLRTDGIAWFYEGQKRIKTSHKLEKDSNLFFKQGRFLISSVSESSDMIDCLFARIIPDTNWGNYGDYSALLQLDLDINNIEDLEEVLCLIDELFGLSSEGSYSIRQWNISWFGFGVSNFLLNAKNWNKRYKENPPRQIHHSETLSFFDSFQDGWMLLNCDQRIWPGKERESMIHHAEILIQLPGVPLDLSLFRRFCREIHNENARFYQTTYHKIFHKRLKKPIRLKVVGEVVQAITFPQDSELAVNGVIAKNPFFKRKKLPKELLDDDNFLFRQLCKLEYLICAVKDWYDLGDVMDAFDLFELDAMQAGSVIVFRPVCTWRNILKRKKNQKFSSNKLMANSIIEKYVNAKKIWDSLKKIKN